MNDVNVGQTVDDDELQQELEILQQEQLDKELLKTGTVPVADAVQRMPAAANGESEYFLPAAEAEAENAGAIARLTREQQSKHRRSQQPPLRRMTMRPSSGSCARRWLSEQSKYCLKCVGARLLPRQPAACWLSSTHAYGIHTDDMSPASCS